jgi:hypothetical protein
VEFRLVEQLIPGEHGYRFFPAFYRHLFDTMRRTPILDSANLETGQTAYDRLVPTRDVGLALKDGGSSPSLQTRRARSLEELRRHSELFFSRIGVTQRDVARFQVRMLKFLTACSERRRREYEKQTWWTFLGGDSERGYSPKMKQQLFETPQALVAMNAEETDARSQGNIVSQLLLHYLGEDQCDLTLSGPTTQVWLRDWKRYLRRQGVRFFIGELGKLEWQKGELVPLVTHTSAWLEPPTTASEETTELYRQSGGATGPPVPVARPGEPTVEVEALGCEEGDYVLFVDDRSYCVTADRTSREDIAEQLAKLVSSNPAVSATARGTRLILTEKREVRLPLPAQDRAVEFDESTAAGEWKSGRIRHISRADLLDPIPNDIESTLLERIKHACDLLVRLNDLRHKLVGTAGQSKAQGELLAIVDRVNLTGDFGSLLDVDYQQLLDMATLGAEVEALVDKLTGLRPPHRSARRASRTKAVKPTGGSAPKNRLNDQEWVYAGRLRAYKPEFDRVLTALEQARRPRRELVPCIEVDPGGPFKLAPPKWVSHVDMAEGAKATNFLPLFPYYFRTRAASDQPDRSILIRVRNAHENLRILGEPIKEDPTHDYRSHTEIQEAFRPDFYLLALPLEAASKLVWRAELERPGQLNGCLAELLEFDRRSYRRSQYGAEFRLIRDQHGRPPREYPLRDFSGVQYYFHNHVRIGKGHTYFPDAAWGLSSISQLAYWRERMSPTGPFMGQLSVDIGNFYAPTPPRRAGRLGRSAWRSTFNEIVEGVWHQVRQGLERDRAGVLAAPRYVHVDEWLRFDHPLGRSFDGEAALVVGHEHPHGATADEPARDRRNRGKYTVWLQGERFTATGETNLAVAEAMCGQIRLARFDSVTADVEPLVESSLEKPSAIVFRDEAAAVRLVSKASLSELDELEASERDHTKVPNGRAEVLAAIHTRRLSLRKESAHPADGPYVVRIRSTVPSDAALVFVTAADPGSYELMVGSRPPYRYAATVDSDGRDSTGAVEVCREIRDRLFEQLVNDRDLPVTPLLSGTTGLLLQPRGGEGLPPIAVRNEHQNLVLVFGAALHVRIEQCEGELSFHAPERATIGYNEAPFLINVVGQWQHRPGVLQPDELDVVGIDPAHGQQHPVFYRIANRRWVTAGTYMATTTRLTTMEAANESARHAVNAILHRLLVASGADYNAQGRMFADWAEIWDPEKHELDDLEPLKRLDQTLLDEGLPHVLDILKIVDAVDAMPMQGQASQNPMGNVAHLLQHALEAADRDWGFGRETLHGVIRQAAERVHEALDPFRVLRTLKDSPATLGERLQRAARAFMDQADDGSTSGGTGDTGA